MKLLVLFCLLLVPLGHLADFRLWQAAGKGAVVMPLEVALCLVAALYLIKHLGPGRAAPLVRAPYWALPVVFAAWSFASLGVNTSFYGLTLRQAAFSSLYLARWCACAVLYYAVSELDNSDRRLAVRTACAGASGLAAFGIYQAIFLPNFAFIVNPMARVGIDADVQGHRLVSTILDPNIAGGFLAIFALLAMAMYLHGRRLWIFPLTLFLAAMIMTVSRGTFAGFVAGLCVLVASRGTGKKRLLWVGLLAAIGIVALWPYLSAEIAHFHRLTIRDPSARSRFRDWALAYSIWTRNWVMGIGYNTFGFVMPLFGVQRIGGSAFGFAGDFALLAVTTGAVGVGLYAAMLARLAASAARLGRLAADPWARGLGAGTRASIISCVTCSLFTSVLLYPSVMTICWVLWAASATELRACEAARRVRVSAAAVQVAT